MGKTRMTRAGQGTLEYVLVLVIILLAIVAGSKAIKDSISSKTFDASNTRIKTAAGKLAAQK